jgi:hypothetical protein
MIMWRVGGREGEVVWREERERSNFGFIQQVQSTTNIIE